MSSISFLGTSSLSSVPSRVPMFEGDVSAEYFKSHFGKIVSFFLRGDLASIDQKKLETHILENYSFTAPFTQFSQLLFFVAIHYKSTSAVRELLEAGSIQVDMYTVHKKTALHLACEAGDLPLVELLLLAGASLGIADPSGMTALHLCVFGGHQDLVQLLLSPRYSADHSVVNSAGYNSLHLASKGKNINILKLLLNTGADLSTLTSGEPALSAFQIACHRNNLLFVQEFISFVRNNQVQSFVNYRSNSLIPRPIPLLRGAVYARFEPLRPGIPNLQNGIQSPGVRNLLEHTTGSGLTALHIAANSGHTSVCRLLLESGANIDAKTTLDGQAFTPLMGASFFGFNESVSLLIAHKKKVSPESFDDFINAKNTAKMTAFQLAADCDRVQTCALLAQAGAHVDAESIHLAVKNRRFDVVQAIVDYGRFPAETRNAEGHTFLINCIAGSLPVNFEMLSFFSSGPYVTLIEMPDCQGQKPIHLTVLQENLDAFKALISAGADVESTTEDLSGVHYTVLHCAAQFDDLPIAEEILRHKKEKYPGSFQQFIDKKTGITFRSALECAMEKKSVKTMGLLLEHGATVDVNTLIFSLTLGDLNALERLLMQNPPFSQFVFDGIQELLSCIKNHSSEIEKIPPTETDGFLRSLSTICKENRFDYNAICDQMERISVKLLALKGA